MKKGIYQPPNIELGFKLTEFHRFWWICVSTGVYQEKEARYQGRRGKNHIPPWNQVEGSRRHEKATHQRRPTWKPPRSADPTPGRPTLGGPTYRPPPQVDSLPHRVCIFAIDQGRFDLRALVHPTSLYKPTPTPWVQSIQVIWSSHQSWKP
jgi:hypothetical protein